MASTISPTPSTISTSPTPRLLDPKMDEGVVSIIVLSCGDVLLFSGIAWVVTLGLYDVVVFPVMAGEITLVHGGAVVSTAMARPGTTYAATGAPSQRPPDPPMLFDLQIRCRCRCLASVSFDLLDKKERQSPLPPAVPRSKLRSPVRSKRDEKKRRSSSRSLCAIGQPATTPHLRSSGREGNFLSLSVGSLPFSDQWRRWGATENTGAVEDWSEETRSAAQIGGRQICRRLELLEPEYYLL
nr:hypothetical protein Iba_chr05cCG17680 [Ipomoea batatas]